jgi:hypothetical protein
MLHKLLDFCVDKFENLLLYTRKKTIRQVDFRLLLCALVAT